MVLASSTNLIKYTNIRQVGFNTEHRSKPLMTTTTDTNVVTQCTPLAIVLLTALYCIVSDEIKCVASGLSCACSKI